MAVAERNVEGEEACSGAVPHKDVSFRSARRWWAGDMALVDLCLSVPHGSLVAVVGDVGAGDETICAPCRIVGQLWQPRCPYAIV